MLGLSLLLHASLIEFIRTGSKIWHQEFWNNDVNSLPSFIGSLFTGSLGNGKVVNCQSLASLLTFKTSIFPLISVNFEF